MSKYDEEIEKMADLLINDKEQLCRMLRTFDELSKLSFPKKVREQMNELPYWCYCAVKE